MNPSKTVAPRARESAQSTGFETLLIAAECSGRVAEAACYIVLIRVSRLEKLNHGIGFGRAIFDRVMGEDDAMNEKHSLALLGLDTNAIVYEDGAAGRSRAGEELLLRRSRAHGFLACSISTDSKSGQFKVRTPLKEKAKPVAASRDAQDRRRAFLVEEIDQPKSYDFHLPI